MADLTPEEKTLIEKLLEIEAAGGQISSINNPDIYFQLVTLLGEEKINGDIRHIIAEIIINEEIKETKNTISKAELDEMVRKYEEYIEKENATEIKTEIKTKGLIKQFVENQKKSAEILRKNIVTTEEPEEKTKIYTPPIVQPTKPQEKAFVKVTPITPIKEEKAPEQKQESAETQEFLRHVEEISEKKKKLEIEIKEKTGQIIEEKLIENIPPQQKEIIKEKIYREVIEENIDPKIINQIINEAVLNPQETQVYQIEMASNLQNLVNENQETITEIKSLDVQSKILEEFSNVEDKKEVIEYSKLIGDLFEKGSDIEKFKKEMFAQHPELSPGEKENIWNNLKATKSLLEMNSKELSEFLIKYSQYENISVNEIANAIDQAINFAKQDPENFRRMRMSYFGQNTGFFGFLRNLGFKFGDQAIGNIGNESLRSFLQNGFSMFKNGGFNLAGIKGFFAKAGAKTATGAAAGAVGAGKAALSGTGWGALLMGLSKLGQGVTDFLKAAGLSLTSGLTNFLKESFGFIGGLVAELIKTGENAFNSVLAIIPIVIISLVLVFGIRQKVMADQLSALAPLTEELKKALNFSPIDTDDNSSIIDCKSNYPSAVKNSALIPESGLILHVFETGTRRSDGRMQQRYDLGQVDPSKLQSISTDKDATSINENGQRNNQLDSRIITAYNQMVNDARGTGIISSKNKNMDDLKLTSGYRSIEEQKRIYSEYLPKYGNDIGKYVATPGCSPHHTGRAIDIIVNGSAGDPSQLEKQRDSITFQWLYGTKEKNYTDGNAAKYGFYNYSAEPWHWEYNPPDN